MIDPAYLPLKSRVVVTGHESSLWRLDALGYQRERMDGVKFTMRRDLYPMPSEAELAKLRSPIDWKWAA